MGFVAPSSEPVNRNPSQGIDPCCNPLSYVLTIYQNQNITSSKLFGPSVSTIIPDNLNFNNGQAQLIFPTSGLPGGNLQFNSPSSTYFTVTDNTNLKLTWAWTLRATNPTSYGLFVVDCISSVCGLGSQDNAIGFKGAGGPDPIILNKSNGYSSFQLP